MCTQILNGFKLLVHVSVNENKNGEFRNVCPSKNGWASPCDNCLN